MDFVFVLELTSLSILHIVDVYYAYSECLILSFREIPDVPLVLERRWLRIYGWSRLLRGDVF